MKIFRTCILLFLALSLLNSCSPKKQRGKNVRYYSEIYKSNNSEPETLILMHNRMGIRIEYNVDLQRLELWISPQAGKSSDYQDRNFSNADDHTKIFDLISFPDLKLEDFIRCDYDPFHSVLVFKNQRLHIASLFDKPAVMIWLDKPDSVDFKSDKVDKAMEQSEKYFWVDHPDRGKNFSFVAALGEGKGSFSHQASTEEGRSIFARAVLAAGQLICISGELSKEDVALMTRKLLREGKETLLKKNEEKINAALQNGSFQLKGNERMQRLLNLNRRSLLSMQDASGAMRTSLKSNNYLLYYGSGSISGVFNAFSGNPYMLEDFTSLILKNPNYSREYPKGLFYGQTMSGTITRWDESGAFWAIWSVFNCWTQTGKEVYVSRENLKVLEEAMNWLERYCFDKSEKLFGRYYFGDMPLCYSHDSRWNGTLGNTLNEFPSLYKNDTIIRSYDIYINSLSCSSYLMLAAMEQGERAQYYFKKALELEKHIRSFWGSSVLPSFGKLISTKKKVIMAEAYGPDQNDYILALSLPFIFSRNFVQQKNALLQLFSDLYAHPRGYSLVSYLSVLRSMDTEFCEEDSLMKALNYLVPQCVRAGKYLKMPNTIVETADIEDGNLFYDDRPYGASIASWLATVTNFGLRRMPFGIAVRATKYLEKINGYVYKNATINFQFQGAGKITTLIFNHLPLEYTYQIPEDKLLRGNNTLSIELGSINRIAPVLVASTIQLDNVSSQNNIIEYKITAFGKNILIFKNLSKHVLIKNHLGAPVRFQSSGFGGYTGIFFEGKGRFLVYLQ